MTTNHSPAADNPVFNPVPLLKGLKGDYVYLEPLDEKYRDVLRELARDERIWEFTRTILVNETYDQQWDKYFNQALRLREDGGISFVIRAVKSVGGEKLSAGEDGPGLVIGSPGETLAAAEAEPIIGMTRLYGVEAEFKRMEIGYTWYIPSVWGKVHNKECKLLLLQYAFEVLGFNRVGLRVAHQNIRSQKAVAKIGGIKEGVLRKNGIRGDGSFADTVLFSIIDDEWPEKKVLLQQMVAQG
ncbi:MAG TPA: GNAT family protein [Puia sp.]|nr:GNAT family protein [Puia sp.]